MLPAYLINMDRSNDRLAHMQREFDRVGIPFVRWPAVDGATLSDGELDEFMRQRTLQGRAWERGEVGCFLSHFGLWQHIAESSDAAAAIIEDDVFLSSDLRRLLASTSWIPKQAGVIKLEANRKLKMRNGRRIKAAPNRRIHRLTSSAWYTAGYIITRAAAARITATPPSLHCTADVYLFFPDVSPVAKGLRRFQISPGMCIQCNRASERGVTFESHVGGTGLPPPIKAKPFIYSGLLPWKRKIGPFQD